jgi:hypothetical protein
MILGYPETPTVTSGYTLTLHISTDAPAFRVNIFRQEAQPVAVYGSDWIAGQFSPMPDSAREPLGWPKFNFPITDGWPSGAYWALFTEGDGNGGISQQTTPPPAPPHPDLVDLPDVWGAFFVVRSLRPTSPILYKIPLFTYHAYNSTANGNLYDLASRYGLHPVTFERPGGGIGGYYRHGDTPDAYDGQSRRQTFAHWDAKYVSWLYERGYTADFCTDLDIHTDAGSLDQHSLMLSVGHDEYWSDQERRNVETFISRGGNVAFFCGNTCWGQVVVGQGLTDDPPRPTYTLDSIGQWPADRPENHLTGVGYLRGGGWWDGRREEVPYRVHRTSHWAFEGTRLADGDVIGAGTHLVGYEVDGAEFSWQGGSPTPTRNDVTPNSFVILGVGELTPGQGQPGRDSWYLDPGVPGVHAACMGCYTDGGTVFNVAVTDWARVLAAGDANVNRITRNVLSNLSPITQVNGCVSLAAYSVPDQFEHVVVATNDNDLWELYWNPQDAQGPKPILGLLAGFAPARIVGVAGYYAAGDEFQHVVVATDDGNLTEVFWKPPDIAPIAARLPVGPFAGIVGVAGYYSEGTSYQHVIRSMGSGDVWQFVFRPTG